ncbi:Outer membrane receptor proteins, mostly Fe transport [Dyadobacter soli]|uniref:Outer membrane receptor proteins, mostly Fe transport n=1 Tax=Dyadobacter soli TaxID=659014 RepID=A0A1G7GD79_9BACT|nr:TonB-dependent receptor [Dyadobacter soli]SDE86084.1 Outer membrane receptor proteins, mostly Fe transport [Dyadobacter soli]
MKNIDRVRATLWLAVALLAALGNAFAQIKGKVTAQDHKPLEGAAVSVLAAADSSVVNTVLTGRDGTFTVLGLQNGSYLASVAMLGFQNFTGSKFELTDSKPIIDLGTITLKTGDIKLNEVKVTGQKNFVEYQIDRTVINVDALISNAGANVLEVLEKSPGVMVDQSGSISLKGQPGVLVLIDNRPTYLSAAALAAYLRSLPANSVEKIELITNPPARYDAAGSAGVINIKIRKNKVHGLNGSITLSPARSRYWRHNENANLNFRRDRFNFFTNASFNSTDQWRRLDIQRRYYGESGALLSSFDQTTFFYPKSRTTNLKTGFDFYANEKTTWGFVYTGAFTHTREHRPVSSAVRNAAGAIDSLIRADNSEQNRFRQHGINLNFSHQYDSTGRLLTFDLDYITYRIRARQTFINDFLDGGEHFKRQEKITTDLPSSIDIYSAKTDYEHPLRKGKFGAGFKTSLVRTDNAANYFLHQGETVSVDYDKTNRFRYSENINAVYVNFNREFQKFSLQTGLRAENTNSYGHQLGNAVKPDSSFSRHYTSLVPTVFLSYKLDTNQTRLNFSYGRRIGRPYYQDLNPFVFLLDKFSYFAGNPYLKPELGNRFQLSLNYKSRFNLSLLYNYTRNMQGEVIEQAGNIFISRTGNISRLVWGGITLTAQLKAGNWWTCNFYAELIRNNFRGMPGNPDGTTGSTYGYISPNNQFLFKNGWSAELSGFYITRSQGAQFDKDGLFLVNTAVQKKVLKDKGIIKLSLRDVFSSLEPNGRILNIPNAKASYYNDADTRVLVASFTYSFSKGTSGKRKRNVGGSGSEEQRVKN